VFWTNFSFSQNGEQRRSYHNTYLEVGGMYFLGVGANYEYSFKIVDFLRINPGLGVGVTYTGGDADKPFYFIPNANLKFLVGKSSNFFEMGVFPAYPSVGLMLGYRRNSIKNPLFFRFSLNMYNFSGTPPWLGISLGYRFIKKKKV
jgi:hypothetical protein